MNTHEPPPPPRRTNPPAAERILVGLWTVIDACQDLLTDHRAAEGQDCDCSLCEDARGLLYNGQTANSCIGYALVGFPAQMEREVVEALRRGDEGQAQIFRRLAQMLADEAAVADGDTPYVCRAAS